MGATHLTDERLKTWLNSDQASRERLCLAILALDRSYSDLHPRRPEGGPDGGRDIECKRNGEPCFGAVGFLNSVTDSRQDTAQIRQKFNDDVHSARAANPNVKAFVFLCNVDLTPGEREDLIAAAHTLGFSSVDVYWRERIRNALDSPEGLAFRFQYLDIHLSEAEQAAFFARFGSDINDLLRGRFDQLERKINELRYSQWKTGRVRSLDLHLDFTGYVDSRHCAREHFRVCLEMGSASHEKRSIFLGGQDDFWKDGDSSRWFFGTKTFFWRQNTGPKNLLWLPNTTRVGGGHISGINLGIAWRPLSDVLVAEFEQLWMHLHFTANLVGRISRVRFFIDDYVFFDGPIEATGLTKTRPNIDWPAELSTDEQAAEWRCQDCGPMWLDHVQKLKNEVG